MKSQAIDAPNIPDAISFQVKNVKATAMAKGDAVCFDIGTFDGIRATQPVTANLDFFAGVVDSAAIAPGEFGYATAKGYGVGLVLPGTAAIRTAGVIVVPVTGQNYLAYSTDGAAAPGVHVRLGEAVASDTTATPVLAKLFLRS